MTTYVKSTTITNLDASPMVMPSAGIGAQAYEYVIDDYVTTSGLATTDVFQVLRVPTHAMIKKLEFMSTAFAASAFDVNITLYYSDNAPFDGSSTSNSGAVDGGTFFASAYSVGTAAMYVPVDVTYGNASGTAGTFALGNEQQALWKAAGLTSDPGGFFDIVVVPSTVTSTVTDGKIYLKAHLVISGAL